MPETDAAPEETTDSPSTDDLLAPLAGATDDEVEETPAQDDAGGTPKETPEETPSEPADAAETPAEVPQDDTGEAPVPQPVAETPAPAPQAPSKPKNDARAQADARYADVIGEIATLRAKLKNDTFDPIEDGRHLAALQLERQDYLEANQADLNRRQQAREQQDQAEGFWTRDFAKLHPGIDPTDARSKFNALVTAYEKRGFEAGAAEVAATGAWEAWLEGQKAAPKPAAAAPARPAVPPKPAVTNSPPTNKTPPAVTKGAARVTPESGITRPPPKPRNEDEEFDQKFAGSLKNLLD